MLFFNAVHVWCIIRSENCKARLASSMVWILYYVHHHIGVPAVAAGPLLAVAENCAWSSLFPSTCALPLLP